MVPKFCCTQEPSWGLFKNPDTHSPNSIRMFGVRARCQCFLKIPSALRGQLRLANATISPYFFFSYANPKSNLICFSLNIWLSSCCLKYYFSWTSHSQWEHKCFHLCHWMKALQPFDEEQTHSAEALHMWQQWLSKLDLRSAPKVSCEPRPLSQLQHMKFKCFPGVQLLIYTQREPIL